MTGGRVKRIERYVGNEPFFLTYGDSVADIDIPALLEFHQTHGKIVTITAANVAQTKGILNVNENGEIEAFREKEDVDSTLINGGFMVCNPEIFRYLQDDTTVLEKEPMKALAEEKQLAAYTHNGFWQCMDTQREKKRLEELWAAGNAPWKCWD